MNDLDLDKRRKKKRNRMIGFVQTECADCHTVNQFMVVDDTVREYKCEKCGVVLIERTKE
jgi:ribosomal protein S27E